MTAGAESVERPAVLEEEGTLGVVRDELRHRGELAVPEFSNELITRGVPLDDVDQGHGAFLATATDAKKIVRRESNTARADALNAFGPPGRRDMFLGA